MGWARLAILRPSKKVHSNQKSALGQIKKVHLAPGRIFDTENLSCLGYRMAEPRPDNLEEAKDPAKAREPAEEKDGPGIRGGLQIDVLPTDKSKIPLTPEMKAGIIPRHGSSVLVCGKSASGKSNMVLNLFLKPNMYAGYFDLIFLVSATAQSGDDLWKNNLKELDEKSIMKPNKAGIARLEHILRTQQNKIKASGIESAPKICIIMDDCVFCKEFMKSDVVETLFLAGRHSSITSFILTQAYKAVPAKCRKQVNSIFFMAGAANSEHEALSEEHCPGGMRSKRFRQIIAAVLKQKYTFLYINKHLEEEDGRYKHNLDTILRFSDAA